VIQVPVPDQGDVPIHETAVVDVDPSTKTTITMSPSTSGNTHRLPVVAISRFTDVEYRITVDGTVRYGWSLIPPTTPGDLTVVFSPSLALDSELKIEIKDLRADGTTRRFEVHAIGHEA
jgi:hypothetical protein